MPKKNAPETPRWNRAGDPVNDAAVIADVKRYLLAPKTAEPKEKPTAKKGKLKKKAAEAARWDQNGDPLNDAAVIADIKRYLGE